MADGQDNCPNAANPMQADCDGDGIGDACDPTSGPPVITQQPQAVCVCPTADPVLSVVATGAVSYQWRRGGVNLVDGGRISGATTATLTITDIAIPAELGSYDCVVSNACGSVTTAAADLAACGPAGGIPGDINGDGRVDQSDLGILLANWGR